MQAVFRDRNEPTAEASFAAIFERSKLGIAIAAMIKMIATTIRSSISENPFCFLPMTSSPGFILPTPARQDKGCRRLGEKREGEVASGSDPSPGINKVSS